MKRTASDFLVERLRAWGVRRIYGYPGDGINGVLGALRRAEDAEDPIRFVQTRHEEMAALMACAHAKFRGETGVCLATSGPGVTHLLTGLYDAKKDHQPVVAIVGQQPTTSLGSGFHQEVDLMSLMKDVAGAYVQMASSASQVRMLVDRAFRIAAAGRTVTAIILPNDVQEQDAVESLPREHGSSFSGVGYREPVIVPREEDLRDAAEVLNAGDRVAMLVGAGALGAGEEVIAVADRLQAGVAKALLGKAVLPDDVPWCTGAIGLLGTRPSWDLMQQCDTLLMVGTSFPYAEFLPEDSKVRAVQVDRKAEMLGIR
ncbi:MAG TPA: thiamine pyrophosphate-binding protein, partial [bacterium]|nr:thiamine pyrophosphate-binding protein [bacterium]